MTGCASFETPICFREFHGARDRFVSSEFGRIKGAICIAKDQPRRQVVSNVLFFWLMFTVFTPEIVEDMKTHFEK